MAWCTILSVWNGAHLDPFLCLQKGRVCGRVGHRVMLMKRSNVCSRTCHRTEASALHRLKPVEVFERQLSAALFHRSQMRAGSISSLSDGGAGSGSSSGSSTTPRQFRLPGVAPVWSLSVHSFCKVIHRVKNGFRYVGWNKSIKKHILKFSLKPQKRSNEWWFILTIQNPVSVFLSPLYFSSFHVSLHFILSVYKTTVIYRPHPVL